MKSATRDDDLLKRFAMFFRRREIGFDRLQTLGSRREHEMAERLRMRLMLRQGDENLFVPEKNVVQIVPRAQHALKMDPEHLPVGGMVVKLGALLPIFRDGPKRRAHLPARGFPATGDVPVDFHGFAIVAAEQPAPPGSLVQHGGVFEQPRRSMRFRKRCQVEFFAERRFGVSERLASCCAVFSIGLVRSFSNAGCRR